MTERRLTCINCPLGCGITVVMDGGEIVSVSGNTCKRGEEYARAECTAPRRTVTGLVRVSGKREPLSVKTAQPIPKELVLDCAALLRGTVVNAPVAIGDVVISDILSTGVDVVATKAVL